MMNNVRRWTAVADDVAEDSVRRLLGRAPRSSRATASDVIDGDGPLGAGGGNGRAGARDDGG